MKKTIKVDELKKEIEILVNDAIRYMRDGDDKLYEYSYNKAISYASLIQSMCIDYSKPSYKKEYKKIDEWFSKITHDAIYK